MGKIVKSVLKVGAIVAGVALAIPTGGTSLLAATLGVSGLAAGAIALGLSVTSSLLSSKPQSPRNSNENLDRLRANLNPRTPRKTVIGNTAMATDIRDEEFTGDQEYFHRFIVCASHEVESIDEIWFDDEIAWSANSGVSTKFGGYLTVATRTVGTAANAINISARMGNSRRFTGMAYVHLRYKLTGNSKKSDSPFAQSITTRITIRGKAARLYDPRNDSTVPGGSGTQRADDQGTWAWDDNACRNPALALLFYLLGHKISGKLALGKGIPVNRIDLESFAVAANICDEQMATESGGQEPRYRCDGVWSEADTPETVIGMLKATMNADLDDVDGKLRLTVFHNDLALPDADFDENDVLDDFTWSPSVSLQDSFNVVRGFYTDPSDNSLYQPVDYPEVAEESPDGITRISSVNLPMVQSPDQAQRLGHLRLMRQKYGGTFKANFMATAWAVQKNSVVRLTFRPLGFVSKLFRVAEIDVRVDGIVPLTLREEHADIYGAPALEAPIDPVASTPYNYTLNPIYQQLVAGEQSLIATSSQSGLTITATTSSITLSNHLRRYTDKSVNVDGATLTQDDQGDALIEGAFYYPYYEDSARNGGSVTWQVTRNFFEAQNSAENPNRHYGGYIRMATTGGGGGSDGGDESTGGGALPPGSGGYDPYTQSSI